MSEQYICPSCKGHLNVAGNVVFSTENSKGQKGLILLHPELGNYKVINNPEFKFKDGEILQFFCPICHAKLAGEKHENLAKILLIDEEKEYHIYFSQKAGEKSTYKIIGDKMEIFGKDSHLYLDILSMR